jgi:hypothetical protein
MGKSVKVPFHLRYCGIGMLDSCRTALWNALDLAGTTLEAAQGPDPTTWRADATPERIRFSGGLLSDRMRWTNRPSFQQVISFSGHRSR